MSKILEKIKNRIPPYKKRMIGISVDIGSQIHEYMNSDGINQRALAEKLGKKESEISKWLSGSHNFTIETIAKIEDVFDKKILLVPMFAMNDLYKYYLSFTSKNDSVGSGSKLRLWGLGIEDLKNNETMASYSYEPQTINQSFGKTG